MGVGGGEGEREIGKVSHKSKELKKEETNHRVKLHSNRRRCGQEG